MDRLSLVVICEIKYTEQYCYQYYLITKKTIIQCCKRIQLHGNTSGSRGGATGARPHNGRGHLLFCMPKTLNFLKLFSLATLAIHVKTTF